MERVDRVIRSAIGVFTNVVRAVSKYMILISMARDEVNTSAPKDLENCMSIGVSFLAGEIEMMSGSHLPHYFACSPAHHKYEAHGKGRSCCLKMHHCSW